jgi:hypothetical protein
MATKTYYKPLPEYLTIKNSTIHGLGLFATDNIDANFRIGVTHVKDVRFPDGYCRTPLGGFFNHSDTPNCKVVHEDEFIFLETLSEIKSGEELTATYTLYNPEKKYINSQDFLEIIKKECEKNNVILLCPDTEKVAYPGSGNMMVSGYFDDKIGPTLACAIGKPADQWYEILVHESCHMDQWAEKSVLWTNIYKDGIDCDKGMDDWLNGVEFHEDEYTHYIRTMQAVEIDCEKRSIKKIKELGLPINTNSYIKRANSYLFFYSVMLTTQKWCDTAPYNVPEIVNMMPDYFLEDAEYLVVPEALLELYKEKCYN